MRILVLGGTGYTGSNIAREAASRGHEVTAVSRSAPTEPVEGVRFVQATLPDHETLAAAVAGQDVVVEALAPRGELAGKVEGIVADVARLAAAAADARLVVIGGWSGLRPADDAPRFVEGDVPPEFRPEAEEMVRALEALEERAPEGLDWLFVSPAAAYGSYAPGEALGRYRVGGSVALFDEGGSSVISGVDFATAVVDEIERRERSGHVGIAY